MPATSPAQTPKPADFAQRLLNWYDQHGRTDLPWQQPRTPYGVWVSEIMLQQTQVNTVIPYYQRFMARFCTLAELANAPLDTVLSHWTGLGYYARARNLHKAAQVVMQKHGGQLPNQFEALLALPGIGRSTAGAIMAQAFNQFGVILDGNVKRLLCRLHGIDGWPGLTKVQQQLWPLATGHTPQQRLADYSQAIMDLGATICRARQPLCHACPMQTDCTTWQQQRIHQLPHPKPKRSIPQKQVIMLVLRDRQKRVLLQQRPTEGIWGGLWSLPEFATPKILQAQLTHMGLDATPGQWMNPVKHAFSHYKLTIAPVLLITDISLNPVSEAVPQGWFKRQQLQAIGLATPVKKILLAQWD